MSTLAVNNIQSGTAGPPIVRNSIGTEIGTFCRAWCRFDGSVANPSTTMFGFNVSSITDNGGSGGGRYTVNFNVPMTDANYATVLGVGTNGNTGVGIATGNTSFNVSKTINSCTIRTMNYSGDGIDPIDVSFAVFR